jgi:hypothetical protein
MPEELMEAPAAEAIETPIEQEQQEASTEETQTSSSQDAATEDVQGDMRTLPKFIKDMQATDPAGYKAAKNDWFSLKDFRERRGDLDFNRVKSFLDENGGWDGLELSKKETAAKLQEYEGLTEAVSKGDSAVLDRMAEVNPQGAVKIIADGIDRLASMDPDTYNGKLGAIFSTTIQQQGVPQRLEKMSWNLEAIGDVIRANEQIQQIPGVVRAFNALMADLGETSKWAQSFGQMAQQPTQRQAPAQDEGKAQWEQEKAQWEQQQFTTAYQGEVKNWRTSAVDKELESFYAQKKDDASLQDIARQTVVSRVTERMRTDKDFQTKLMALEARRDKDGALKLIQSREKAAIAEIAPQVGRSIFGQPKAKEEPAAAPRTTARASTPAAPPKNSRDAVWDEIFAR